MSDTIPVLPPKEALDFWRKKVPMTAESFQSLAAEYRVRAFTVSKLSQLDQIMAVQKSLDRALSQGKSMTEWRENIENFFVRAGWTGNVRYRLDTIFRTNIQTAHAAGRWAQAQDGKEDRPLAMYDAIEDGRTRPTHLAQDGKVYPLDHPFWREWWPPNGYRCRCSVRTLSREDAKSMGLKIQDKIDGVPDEGFQTNPGHAPSEARIFAQTARKKLSEYTPALRQHFLEAATHMPFQAMSRYLHKRDIESMQVLLWAQEQGGVDGYEDWIDALDRDRGKAGEIRKRGRVYPLGNIPAPVASRLTRPAPDLALVVITDEAVSHLLRDAKKDRGATLTLKEVKSIPRRFRDKTTEWYEDQKNPGTLMAWERIGKKWLKVTIRVNDRVEKVSANVVKTAGVIEKGNIAKGGRYKKITH